MNVVSGPLSFVAFFQQVARIKALHSVSQQGHFVTPGPRPEPTRRYVVGDPERMAHVIANRARRERQRVLKNQRRRERREQGFWSVWGS